MNVLIAVQRACAGLLPRLLRNAAAKSVILAVIFIFMQASKKFRQAGYGTRFQACVVCGYVRV